MAEKAVIRFSARIAAYLGRTTPKEIKMRAVRREVDLTPSELATIHCYLAFDEDPEIRSLSLHAVKTTSPELFVALASLPTTHPRVLDLLARIHHDHANLVAALQSHPDLLVTTRAFLASVAPRTEDASESAEEVTQEDQDEQEQDEDDPAEEIDEESEEFRSKYQQAQVMGVGEKIKMALTGDKEWRSILLKDSNKLVSGSVVKNPRMTEPEVLAIVKSTVQHDEILRIICANKEWIKNYQIRKGLVLNSKTPLPFAIRCLGTLTEKDVGLLAKSKNISSVIATQARRLLANKNKR